MEAIIFNEKKHTYSVKGVNLPSVTTVLSGTGIIDKRWFTKGSAHRGTTVHSMLEWHDDMTLDLDQELDERLVPFLEGWKKFLVETQIKLIDIEKAVYHPKLRYAGMVDRFGLIGGTPYVIDLKTGGKAKWHSLQTMAYQACYKHDKGERKIKRMCVYLNDKGKYKIEEHTKDAEDFSVFVSALTVYNWIQKNVGGKKA